MLFCFQITQKALKFSEALGVESMATSTGRSRNGNDYRYYTCRKRIAKGKQACDHPRIAAAEIEPIIPFCSLTPFALLEDWAQRLDAFLEFNERDICQMLNKNLHTK
jgi:hypothetical protein